ncbi:GntR family transcriptional regulator [Vannielia litorea]|nr:GntR family transcriptional regulator [Vannielia litorea]MBY6076460.1 GntR family transcriptional regulator [Vannielia litorea]
MQALRFSQDHVEGETVGDGAYRRIRADIVSGKLRPLERLKLEQLREAYSVSVTTLREILTRLAAEDLVTAEGQRGFRVAPVSLADLKGLAELRTLLEVHALRLSLANGDLDWQGQVVSAHYKLSVVEQDLLSNDLRTVAQWVEHDWGFHHATIAACATEPLMRMHAAVFDRYMRYHMLVLDFRGKPAADDHERLRDLVLERKTEAAVDLLTRHIGAGLERMLQSGKIPE